MTAREIIEGIMAREAALASPRQWLLADCQAALDALNESGSVQIMFAAVCGSWALSQPDMAAAVDRIAEFGAMCETKFGGPNG